MSGLGDFSNLLKQAQKMQKEIARIQEDLKDRVVEGTAGGGMVKSHVNGKGELLSIKIDPSVVDPEDVELLEDLVTAAVKQGLKNSKDLQDKELSGLTGGLGLPGIF
ncbi:MAG: YbaB/EbfC family nucleoid-associated protein [Planctomycetes bacterium]|nr:YbaB/EbfC family nucleoid-associated protein [Planctomycetota bacterium]